MGVLVWRLKVGAPLMWSVCSWVSRMAVIEVGGMGREERRWVVWRAEKPQSMRRDEVLWVIRVLLPLEPLPRLVILMRRPFGVGFSGELQVVSNEFRSLRLLIRKNNAKSTRLSLGYWMTFLSAPGGQYQGGRFCAHFILFFLW